MELELTIDRLGAGGDGVAQGPQGTLFVPFALPGERVKVRAERGQDHAALLDVLTPSPERIAPICPHFGVCGGCALQHLAEAHYLAWKRDLVRAALRSRGLDVEVEPALSVPLASRRRASFALARTGAGPVLGYHQRASHDIIDIATCPVLEPAIMTRLPRLKSALARLAPAKGAARLLVTATETGLDVAVEGGAKRLGADDLAAFAAGAASARVGRLTLNGEMVMQQTVPTLAMGGAKIALPPGAFLQASCAAEALLVDLVRAGVGEAKRVADLFAGLGPFTLALAPRAAIDAFDQDEASLAALAQAARATPKLKPVRTVPRDLFRSPLRVKELETYDAVIFDPPRAGAKVQAAELARSSVPCIVAVSCHPGTLARDLRLLVVGGYRLTRVVPVDQFRFSPHIEAVAHLER
jgi:23S rRNA (uracil1939-C5)-methyltransferase